MNLKRIIAVLLALITVFVLVGCGKSRRPVVKLTLSTEDAVAILAAAGISLPDVEDVTCANTTVKWFASWDPFRNYSDEEIVNSGYWVFTEKYGCEVEWVETTWEERFSGLATKVSSNQSPDFFPLSTEIFPNYVMKEVFQPVNDYVDYTDPLWAGTAQIAKDYLTLGDKVYGFVQGNGVENVMVYNRRVMEENGFDDPAELYYAGDWTWDVFLDMCIDFSDPDQQKYALDAWWWDIGVMESTGTDIMEYDLELGEYVSNLDDPRLERAANLISELQKNQCMFPVWANGWKSRDNNAEGAGIKDGLTLFWVASGYGPIQKPVSEMALRFGDMEQEEIMFVPMPRDPDGDGKHYVTASYSGYALVTGAKNPEGVGLLAACNRFKSLDHTVKAFNKRQLVTKYLWNDEMLAMQEEYARLVEEGNFVVPTKDGVGGKLYNSSGSGIINKCKALGRTGASSTSWAQIKETYSEQLKYYIDALNLDIEEYEASLVAGE